MEESEEEIYWKNKKTRSADKELWARVRCGNLVKAGKKGEKDWKCRECREKEETLMHVLTCEKIRNKLTKESKEEIKKWWEESEDEDKIKKEIVGIMKGRIRTGTCKVIREIENNLKKNEREREIGKKEK
ncbi:uncharacterized protein LOC141535900 [Cotesia typhae]|uniref:uncharacterized protein LOC141535900 n=1 Tax=Cotesia typhae TaxID=2053667 RepID=UPI003D688FF3